MENGTTVLFGLPGVAVQRVERTGGDRGELTRLIHVVTAASSAAGCPVCGVVSTSVRQYRTTRPRDLPYGEEPLQVHWHKRQYRCRELACPRKAFTESIAELPPRARLTGRLCRAAARQVASGARCARWRLSWGSAGRWRTGITPRTRTRCSPSRSRRRCWGSTRPPRQAEVGTGSGRGQGRSEPSGSRRTSPAWPAAGDCSAGSPGAPARR